MINVNHRLDELSIQKAYQLFESGDIDQLEVGTFKGLSDIHHYLFDGVYLCAGRIVSAYNHEPQDVHDFFLKFLLRDIDMMPETIFEEIIAKYVEMNRMHFFMQGNGRATRIWLDMILKKRQGFMVNWQLVDKDLYLLAMDHSRTDDLELRHLLQPALTDRIDDKEMIFKAIEQSYFYAGFINGEESE